MSYFDVFDVLVKQIMVRLVPIGSELHEHVVSSPFLSRAFYTNLQNIELNI